MAGLSRGLTQQTKLESSTVRILPRFAALVACLVALPPLAAFYGTASLLPGDAVDAQTDLTQYSFSVPHQLKKFGGTFAPGYSHSSHDIHGSEIQSHDARLSLFAFAQWNDFRLGVVARQQGSALGTDNRFAQTDNKLMLSYLWRFVSFGAEAGGYRSTKDTPHDRWGAQFALTSSLYFNKWAIDAVARIYRPNSSLAAKLPLADGASDLYLFQNPFADNAVYSLRWRYDLSFHWRMTLAGNYLRSGYGELASAANLWRYRANAMQLITGLRYEQGERKSGYVVPATLQREVHWPVLLILEHSRSIFYVGGSSPVYKTVSQGGFEQTFWTFRFEPRVAYIYRFNGKIWAGFSVAEQSATIAESYAPAIARKEIRAAFQLTYNLVPFGYDDEIPLSDHLLLAAR